MRRIKTYVFASGIIMGLLCGGIAFADNTDVVDEVSITVPVSCTMSGTGMNSHNAEISNGTYEDDIGTTTLHAFCNDNNGFSIYATGYTGNEIGGTNSNKLVGTSASGNATIITGIATTAGNPDVSNWAMKLAITSDSGDTTGTNALTIDSDTEGTFSSYHTVPNTYTKVAHKNSATNMDTTNGGVKLTTTYAAYISKTQPADTYTGQVIYTLIHPASNVPMYGPMSCEAGKICYSPNANDYEGTMGKQTTDDSNNAIADNGTVTLLASNFSRDGYGFAGWSDVYNYETNSNAHFYGPQETITIPEGTTANGLTLYAVWIQSAGYLQDSTKVAQLCGTGTGSLTQAPTDGTANLTSVSALTDKRDHQTYAIAKLADGKCWMIENLRLEAEDTRGQNKYDSSVTNESLAQGYGKSAVYGNFIGLADAESSFPQTYSANSLYSKDGSNNTVNIGSNEPASRMPRYNNMNTYSRAFNPISNTFENDNTIGGMYSFGNYYSWRAAIADTTYYPSNEEHGATSLCPTGWRLPRGSKSVANNSFGALSVALGGPADGDSSLSGSTPTGEVMLSVFKSFPNNFLFSGYFMDSSVSSRGTYGRYWSSTGGYVGYLLTINHYRVYYDYYSTSVFPGTDSTSTVMGCSIRCTVSAGT